METSTQEATAETGQELEALEQPGQETELEVVTRSAGEIEALARRLSKEYEERLDFYTSLKRRRDFPEIPIEEHFTEARKPDRQDYAENAMQHSAENITWTSMETIMNYNPEMFWRKWEEVKEQAARELSIGHTQAMACMAEDTPWSRAQYCAIRNELCRDWNPRNGIEQLLIDQMTQAYTQILYWQKIMLRWMNIDAFIRKDAWNNELPRVNSFEAVNRASDMVDRFNRMFLRTLRALQNMRRVPVIVQNAGQVNFADKQVNVSASNGQS